LGGLLIGLAGLVGLRPARAAEPADTGQGRFPRDFAPGAGGREETYRYDAAGRLVFASQTALPAPCTTTIYSYYGQRDLTYVTDPVGSVTTFTYYSKPSDPGA
jgi:hypothetical protein